MPAAEFGSLPFAEQIEAMREKVAIPTNTWSDVYGAENDQAFMVAGASRQAIVEDFQRSVQLMIEEGKTLADFRKDFDQIVERHGWAYKGNRGWRSRVIYDTNLRQSYAAGRERQMEDPELRRLRPFGLYRHGGSENPRSAHLANDGRVVPLDDPWWDFWTPQNGYGCSCKKYMVSRRQAEREGYTVSERGPDIEYVERTIGENGPNPRTVRVAKGIDPGFDHRPGSGRARGITPRPNQSGARSGTTMPNRQAQDAMPDYAEEAEELLEADQPEERYVDAFLERFGTQRGGDVRRFTDAAGESLPISEDLFRDGRGGWLLPGDGQNLGALARTLREPDEIWTALETIEGERPRLRRRYLSRFVLEGGEEGLFMVDWGRDGWSGQRLENAAELEAWRRGVRLYRRDEETD
ncbi:Phage Mu protein F like protein [Vreelandella subterranea]|uniref:Phage Mu protein F like protein n=1 Tax=Vreelandella subterranea TaxID=416874 RepID=A0A1H9UZW1_9GAMM|nr:PBECR2 nuclease fold domain-containing protein [Halomonas subterranea]SES15060.1 Phage Mu protein F like protein [Halomonas subterranea]